MKKTRILQSLRGQSIIEYSMLIVIIIAALMSVGFYFKRGVQGRWKKSVDELGDQYNPLNSNASVAQNVRMRTNTSITTQTLSGGRINTSRVDTTSSRETKRGTVNVGF